MDFKKISEALNLFAQCKKYRLSVWQCPQFLFVIMGIVISVSALTTYILGTHYIVADPTTVTLIVFVLTIVLFVITFSITRSLEGLAEANRLKSEFVSVVSHQLRSPLSNLKWALELLMSKRFGSLEGKQLEYVKILKDNVERMGELVSSLLTVARIEQGRLPLHNTEFSLGDLVRDVIAQFEPIANASNIEIKFESQESLPMAFGDSSQIKLVIENFIDNAVRYTKKEGEVLVKIEKASRRLLCSVRDQGVGIPKQDQKHIFQKFFRSKNVLKYQTQGSGLGLYITKSIIERSKGKIGFKSQENKGSTFWFTLPIKI